MEKWSFSGIHEISNRICYLSLLNGLESHITLWETGVRSRWECSSLPLVHTLPDLHPWQLSLHVFPLQQAGWDPSGNP